MIYLLSCCRPVLECLSECRFSCCNWFNKPLGPYVILAMLLSGFEISQCMLALLDEDLKSQCEGIGENGKAVGIENWISLQFGLACINFIFAPYIQFRLWQNLQEEASELVEDGESGQRKSHRFTVADAFVDVPRAKIKEAFWNVFLYDFGVCAYVFVLVGSGFWSYLGTQWFGDQVFCDADDYVPNAITAGSYFVIFVTLYFIGFMFYMNCVTTLEVNPAANTAMRAAAAGGYALAAQQAMHRGVPSHMLPAGPPVPGVPPAEQQQQGMKGSKNGNQQKQGLLGMFGGEKTTKTKQVSTQSANPGAPPPAFADAPQQKLARTPMERALQPAMMIKLLACLSLDLMGDATYFLPGLGEGLDLAYAPAQAIALKMMFRYTTLPVVGFVEEILPDTDILPSATIGWLLEVCAPDNAMTRAIGIRSDYSP